MTGAVLDGRSFVEVAGVRVEVAVAGRGRPLLFLHPGDGLDAAGPCLDELSRHATVHAASHPGFGASDLPRDFSSVDDLSYFYLDLIEHWDLRDLIVVGVSFGSWLAAEIAVKNTSRIAGVVLADPIGVKFSGPEASDIADIFSISTDEWRSIAFHDPEFGKRDFTRMSEAAVRSIVRNREAITLFSWSPYAHNPKLRRRLHRIDAPVLLVWGESDRIVGLDYVRSFAAELPQATIETIPECGHYPHVEKSGDFAARVAKFVASTPPRL